MITERTIKNTKKFCNDNIKEIEGYNEAIISNKRYCCHHKNGLYKSREQLKEEGLYYNRPACELLWIEIGEHTRLHNQNLREETRKKRSDVQKGKHHTNATKLKMSAHKGKNKGEKNGFAKKCTINGTTYGSLADAYRELNPKYTYSLFCIKYKKGEL